MKQSDAYVEVYVSRRIHDEHIEFGREPKGFILQGLEHLGYPTDNELVSGSDGMYFVGVSFCWCL